MACLPPPRKNPIPLLDSDKDTCSEVPPVDSAKDNQSPPQDAPNNPGGE